MKSRLLALLALPLVGCLATPGGPEATESTEQATTVCGQTSVKGVDVSHYDGTVDWTQAKAAGISFGFAKATESTVKPIVRSHQSPTRLLKTSIARQTPLKNRIGKIPWPTARNA